jgi:peptidoglycan/LPS O-acetylase OafA/YrhL
LPLPQYTEYRERRTFSSLDGFRCASILPVVWHHTGDGLEWLMASQRGYLGVDMFFVLSGFLIVTLILRERDATSDISLKKFYARRAFRIFPIYYAVMLLMVVVLALIKPDAKMAAPFFSELPFYLTYTSNWINATTFLAIAWSLAAEEQFYMIWPPIEKYLKNGVVPILVVAIALNQLINFQLLNRILWDVFEIRWIDLSILQATFTPILLGVVLAHMLHDESSFAKAWKLLGQRWMPLVLLVILFAVSNRDVWDISGWP